jgi:hypothetical protein
MERSKGIILRAACLLDGVRGLSSGAQVITSERIDDIRS